MLSSIRNPHSMLVTPVLHVLLLICTLYCPLALAQITIDKAIVEFSHDQQIQHVIVTNTGERDVYIQTWLYEVKNPHMESPERVLMSDARIAPLLVSPRQTLVPAGQGKRLRVILRENATNIDRIFRLKVKPYVGKVVFNKGEANKTSSGVKVSVGYNILVISRPENQRVDVDVKRDSDSISLENRGNTNVLLRKVSQCDQLTNECIELAPNRLYAGELINYELPFQGDAINNPVEVVQVSGQGTIREFY